MIKTGPDDTPNLVELKEAIKMKQPLSDFLDDLKKILKAYVHDAREQESASENNIKQNDIIVNGEHKSAARAKEEGCLVFLLPFLTRAQ